MSIYKIQQFHLNTVYFFSKNLAFKDPSNEKLHDVTDIRGRSKTTFTRFVIF